MKTSKKQILEIPLGIAAITIGGLWILHDHFLPPYQTAKKNWKYPYVLLLGCAVHNDGKPSNAMKERVNHAVKIWREGGYETLVISGGAVKNEYCEAETMKQLIHAQEPNIPILTETKARNTWENFQNTRDLIGDQPLLILTGKLHARRANAIAKNFFSNSAVSPNPDFRFRRLGREIISRAKYISIELGKERR